MVSRVVCIRHGKPISEGYADDTLRPLSDEGKEIQRKVIQRLKDDGVTPNFVLTSPLLRAQQTAQIVTDVFSIYFENEPALGTEFDAEKLLERIPRPEQNLTLFIVGHEPTLGKFVNDLVGETVLPDGLSKSSAAVIEFEEEIGFGKGKLIHYYKP